MLALSSLFLLIGTFQIEYNCNSHNILIYKRIQKLPDSLQKGSCSVVGEIHLFGTIVHKDSYLQALLSGSHELVIHLYCENALTPSRKLATFFNLLKYYIS